LEKLCSYLVFLITIIRKPNFVDATIYTFVYSLPQLSYAYTGGINIQYFSMATSCVYEKHICTISVAGLGEEFQRFPTPHFLRNKLKKLQGQLKNYAEYDNNLELSPFSQEFFPSAFEKFWMCLHFQIMTFDQKFWILLITSLIIIKNIKPHVKVLRVRFMVFNATFNNISVIS